MGVDESADFFYNPLRVLNFIIFMLKTEIAQILQKINARLALHGGSVALVDFDPGAQKLTLKLQGACQGCPMAQLTTENFIKQEIVKQYPEIKQIKMEKSNAQD